jgi:hypothetical protein
VDLQKLRLEKYRAIITLDRYTPQDEARLLSFVSNLTNAQYLARNMWNIELDLVVENSEEYRRIIEGLKGDFPSMVKDIKTVLILTEEQTPGFANMFNPPKAGTHK